MCKKVFSAQNCRNPIPGARASMVYSGTERRQDTASAGREEGKHLLFEKVTGTSS